MLEMLNPTAGDLFRYAASTLAFRSKFKRCLKESPADAGRLICDEFCRPPASARIPATVKRLEADSKKFFYWNSNQWKQHEPAISLLFEQMQTSKLSFEIRGQVETVACYQWAPTRAVKSSPKRLLLSHGWEGYGLNFAMLISKARAQGFEVITFDHLAHGASSGQFSGVPIALETLIALGQHFGHADVLVGHSLGGAVAGWAATRRAFPVKKLVLIAPFYDTNFLTSMWCKAHLLDANARQLLQTTLEIESGKKFDDFMPDEFSRHLHLPCLIVHDPKDKITAFTHSAKVASKAQQVTLLEAPRVGHIGVLADEASMQKIIEFALA
jgi:pimeloyl-ACP methyl ester carboxylesterase